MKSPLVWTGVMSEEYSRRIGVTSPAMSDFSGPESFRYDAGPSKTRLASRPCRSRHVDLLALMSCLVTNETLFAPSKAITIFISTDLPLRPSPMRSTYFTADQCGASVVARWNSSDSASSSLSLSQDLIVSRTSSLTTSSSLIGTLM